MAETAQQPQTIEINDAYFCQHFKEVVSAHHWCSVAMGLC